MDERTLRVLLVCLTVLALAGIGALAYSCEHIDERRERCIESGKSADDCRRLFNINETRHH